MTDDKKISTLFAPRDRDSVIDELRNEPGAYGIYRRLTDDLKERMLGFFCGKKTLPLTYDPFFKKMFNPEIHPERLESFIGSVIGKKVIIKDILPTEERLLQGASLLIMDMVVELEDGTFANVEIQKIAYLFPAQRMSCYSADLVLRQYSRVKGKKGRSFTYGDLKKVYTIVIFEDSPDELKEPQLMDTYVHFGRTKFATGIELDMLQEYCLISLDVFQKSYYSKGKKELNELNGGLALLSMDSVDRLDELVADYPQMKEIIVDMAGYLQKPEEVIGMFSDALKKLDENTVYYMIEQQKKEIQESKDKLAKNKAELEESKVKLEESKVKLEESKAELEENKVKLEESKVKLEENKVKLEENKVKLEENKVKLEESKAELTETKAALAEALAEIERLKKSQK